MHAMKNNFLCVLALAFFMLSCSETKENKQKTELKTATDANGYTYEFVTNDPLNARIYTLKNGLKVFLTQYKDAPRIQTQIAINAGGALDPADNTGLAHYLEHMLFKGTSSFGTLDWENEKPLLEEITQMFDHYRTLTNLDERKAYYRKIDSVSNVAAKYAIPNEYDKLVSLLGAKGTNAYTNEDRTVYINDIPTNELERWLKVEQFRFRELVPRLFHTELEAVYEEKNQSLDNDYWKAMEKMSSLLWPTHPYGSQTVIGTIEHLKNPSITAIKKYFDAYYIPNNAAICLSGDLDFDQTIAWIDTYFGDWEAKELQKPELAVESVISEVRMAEVLGPNKEWVSIAFRLPGANTAEATKATLVDMIMSNSSAGLIDLNLMQKQKVISAGSYVNKMKEYCAFNLTGSPREGQTLDEVRDLLLGELEKVKKGDFEDWLLDAVVNDLEVNEMQRYTSNWGRAAAYVTAFNQDIAWLDYVKRFEDMRKITKQELMDFASTWYKDNYAIVYKRTGKDSTIVKVDKPEITRVQVNRDTNSAFYAEIESMKPQKLQPLFIDYDNDIQKVKLADKVPVHYTENKDNTLFSLMYLLNMGTLNNKKLEMAVNYLEYLGTDSLSAEDFKKEMYKIGSSFNVFSSNNMTYITLSGLERNLEASLQLFEHLLTNVKADEEALTEMVEGVLKKREDSKKDKFSILYGGMMDYAKHGENSPAKYILSAEELKNQKGEELTAIVRDLLNFEHRILYYGRMPLNELKNVLKANHYLAAEHKALPDAQKFEFVENKENEVYWTHYDMVQTDIMMFNNNEAYDESIMPLYSMYNEYFGGGMGSILFQEMRESRALAYSVWASFSAPYMPTEPFGFRAFIGTQVDKLPEAVKGMFELINEPPISEKSFENARESVLSKIESERITKSSVLFNYETALRMGYTVDPRKAVYEQAQSMKLQDVLDFHQKYIKDRKYRIMVLGDRNKINFKELEKYGKVKELSLEEVLGY